MPITAKWSRSKPEVEFQYSGRLFFKTGSSYFSAVNWDMSTKCGVLIDIDVLKAATSTNTKPEVVLSGRGGHLDKWIWPHISAVGAPIWTKFGSRMQNNTPITAIWSISKPEVEFRYGGRLFFKTVSYISAVNWDMSTKCGVLIDIDHGIIAKLWYWDTVRTASRTILRLCRRNDRQRLPKTVSLVEQELSYRQQIARQLRTIRWGHLQA